MVGVPDFELLVDVCYYYVALAWKLAAKGHRKVGPASARCG